MAFSIYTKTGDGGETGLFGGRRVLKSDLRVDAYGSVDELNAFIGFLADHLAESDTKHWLLEIQHRLFSIGSHLASDPDKGGLSPDIFEADVAMLEQAIDRMDADLPPLRNFILPGGHPAVSLCHVCRTVCRRAERIAVALHQVSPIHPEVLHYLNRLSDFFFLLARKTAHDHGVPEMIWKMRSNP
jgi:cob(I)alamin adenosyltransferase